MSFECYPRDSNWGYPVRRKSTGRDCPDLIRGQPIFKDRTDWCNGWLPSPSHTDLLLVEASEGIFPRPRGQYNPSSVNATTNFEFHRYLHQKQSGIEEDMVMAEKEGLSG